MTDRPTGRKGLLAILETLSMTPGIVGAVLATEDGLPLASKLKAEQDEEGLAAAASVMGQLGVKTSIDNGLGVFQFLCIETSRLWFFVSQVPSLGHLLVLADCQAEFEEVLSAIQRAGTSFELTVSGFENLLAA